MTGFHHGIVTVDVPSLSPFTSSRTEWLEAVQRESESIPYFDQVERAHFLNEACADRALYEIYCAPEHPLDTPQTRARIKAIGAELLRLFEVRGVISESLIKRQLEREREQSEAEIARLTGEARQRKIEGDKARAAAHSTRADVVMIDGKPFVSVEGMAKDLAHWDRPPDLFNEGGYGFDVAIANVAGYLKAREKDAKRI